MEDISLDSIVAILKGIRPDVDFHNEQSLLNDGVIDSLDLIRIIGDIEERFEIKVDFNSIEKADFNSVESIYRLVTRNKTDGRGSVNG